MRARFGVVVLLSALVLSCSGTPSVDKLCAGVSCEHGHCVADSDHAACLCDAPWYSTGLGCAQASSSQCNPATCAGTDKTCVADDYGLSCLCPAGTADVNGSCVNPTACAPNPCTRANQSCVVNEDHADCQCDPGYAPEGLGCTSLPVFDCSRQHAGDAFEPDECPANASTLPLNGSVGHTLSPVGDFDWIKVPGSQGRIVRISVSGATFPIYIDVYEADGVTAIGANHDGTSNPSVTFLDSTGEPHFARIHALRANDSGPYQVTASELGIDDYANDSASALTISPGNHFTGAVQYAGDVDVVKVPVQAQRSYAIGGDGGVLGNRLELEVRSVIGAVSGLARDNTAILAHPSTDGALTLTVRGNVAGGTGTFDVPLVDLGPDDRSDTVADSQVISPTGINQAGVFERLGDVDVVRFNAVGGHGYLFTCGSIFYSTCVVTLRDSAGSVLASNAISGSGTVAAEAKADDTWSASMTASWNQSVPFSYPFKLEDLGRDDFGDDNANAATLSIGQPKSGRIETAGDVDVFSFAATAGRVYSVACTASGSYTTCPVVVQDATGVVVAQSNTTYSSNVAAFGAAATGTYFAHVTSSNGSFSYSIVVTDLGPDDHGNTDATATTIVVSGQPRSGQIQYPNDLDVFSFSATAGRLYGITCVTSVTGVCGMTIREPAGTTLVQLAGYGGSPSVVIKATTTGTYAIELGNPGSLGNTGSYTLSVADSGTDDFGDTPANSSAITAGSAATTGSIESYGDVDVFSFTASADHIYRFSCNSNSSGVCGLTLKIANGNTLQNSYPSSPSKVEMVAPWSGAYYVEVGALPGNYTGPYTVQLLDLGTDDHGDTSATATPLAFGTSISGEIQYAADVDAFSFTPTLSNFYSAECTSSAGACYLSLQDANGFTIASGGSQPVYFRAGTGGSWLATNRAPGANNVGAYTVRINDLGPDDYGDNYVNATPISLGTAYAGQLQTASDSDWFSIALTTGRSYTVTTGTSNSSVQTSILHPNGTSVLAYGVGSVTFTVPASGTYYVDLSPGSFGPAPYTLTVQ